MNPDNIVIKSVPQLRVIAARESSAQPFDAIFKKLHAQVSAFAADHNLKATGPMMGIFFEDPTDPDCDCDFAVDRDLSVHAEVFCAGDYVGVGEGIGHRT